MTAATSARPVTVAQASRGGGSGVAAGGCGVVWPGSPGVAGPTAYTVYDARRPTGGIFSGQAHSDTGAVPREGIAIRRVSRISCQVLLRGVPTKCTSGRATGGGDIIQARVLHLLSLAVWCSSAMLGIPASVVSRGSGATSFF